MNTVNGAKYLSRIELSVEFKRRIVTMPVTAFYEYASSEKVFRRTAQHSAKMSDGSAVELHVDLDSPALDRQDTRHE